MKHNNTEQTPGLSETTAVKLGFIPQSDLGYAENPSLSSKRRQTEQQNSGSGSYLVPLTNLTLHSLNLIGFFNLSWFEFSFADRIGKTQIIITLALKWSLKI